MTEYWVSQGNKWCDFCKIYIANNPLSIRTHELGKRHKDNVSARLASMRKESAAKEKEKKEAAKALEQIEVKAQRSYQKDLAAFQEANKSRQDSSETFQKDSNNFQFSEDSKEWQYDAASGYYCNSTNGYFYDRNSHMYFSNDSGKWIKEEELFASSSQVSKPDKSQLPVHKDTKLVSEKSPLVSGTSSVGTTRVQGGQPPGLVISKSQASLHSVKSVKAASSSIAITKRKRVDEKPKAVSKEEATALKARESARKRVEEREKHLLGLYRSY
uniref:WW domain-binding protein 4 n=1 Tax=Anthurium amnicola TaxID=1678845 RepID=A0A1D1YRH8_9ARAE